MSLNQFSDLTFAEFKKLLLWREPQVTEQCAAGGKADPGCGGLWAELHPLL